MIPSITTFIENILGKEFTESPNFDLGAIFNDSNNQTPLIFVLSAGSDPFASL